MKKIILSIALVSAVVASNAQTRNIFKAEANDKAHWKNPAASFILSALIPGAGQMYNDQTYVGLGVFGAEAILVGVGVTFLKIPPYKKESGYYGWWYNVETDRRYEYTGYAFIGLAGALYLAQLVHAPIISHKKNKANSYAMNKQETEYDLRLLPAGGGLALQVNF